MKIFISWSGLLSRNVALAFKEWIPCVIQSAETFISADIKKGARWGAELAKALEETSFGILCVTRSNINAPWLLFEAGSLSKVVQSSCVIPVLVDLPLSELRGPLEQFQSVLLEKDDLKRLVVAINESSSVKSMPDNRISHIFETWYPDIDKKIRDILGGANIDRDSSVSKRKFEEGSFDVIEHLYEETARNGRILEERWISVDEAARCIEKATERLENTISTTRQVVRSKPSSSMMRSSYIYDITFKSSLYAKSYAGLQIILSFFKEDYSWIYDAGLEVIAVYKSSASLGERTNALTEFKEMVEFTFCHPLMRDVYRIDEKELAVGLRLIQLFECVCKGRVNEN